MITKKDNQLSEGKRMLVKVKSQTGGPIMVPLSPLEGQPAHSVDGKMFLLVDGWNEIPADVWPHVEATMEDGANNGTFEYKCKVVDEEYEEEVDGKKVKKTKQVRLQIPLQDVRADQARAIIKECYNPYVLNTWAKDSKLSGELRALVDMALKDIDKLGEE